MRKDLTTGNITKTIIVTAVPMVLALLVQIGFNVVDAIYVGRISAEAIAAVSLAFPIMFFIFAIAGGIGVGATSVIARYIGAKEVKKADNAAEHALLAALVLGVIFTVLGMVFGKQILMLMGADSLLDLSWDYLGVIFLGTVFVMVFVIVNSIFRGEGDTKTPMMFMIIATVTNIILDPIFIFLLGMGVKGAAIATVISNIVGCVSIVTGFMMGKSSIRIRPRNFHFNFDILKKIFAIGIPSSLAQVSMSLSAFVMMRIVAYFGAYAIAAFGIAIRLDGIAVLPALGLMMALIPIIGQNIGAKKIERAEKSAYRAATIAALFSGSVGLLFFLFPSMFVSIFNTHQEVIQYGVSYLRIVPLAYAFIGINICISGAFLGTGNALTSLFFTLLRVIILVIPLALLLAFVFNLGIIGVWWAYPISLFISAVSSFLWFRTGRWKKAHHLHKEEIPEVVA